MGRFMLYNIKSLPLYCVFHGIRFKVIKDWVSVIDTLLFYIGMQSIPSSIKWCIGMCLS